MADGKGSIALKKEEQRHRFSDRGLSGTSEISAEGILLKEISRNAVHTGSERAVTAWLLTGASLHSLNFLTAKQRRPT